MRRSENGFVNLRHRLIENVGGVLCGGSTGDCCVGSWAIDFAGWCLCGLCSVIS